MTITDDDHDGYVAGRYRDGSVSDEWTDVERCAGGTFVAYLPRCTCGWSGRDRPVSGPSVMACRREWFLGHVVVLPAVEPAS